jgi:hypothetical protein
MAQILLPATGVLFSNANHNVIFLNKTLQTMLKYPESAMSVLIGKPVHEILGISEEQYQQFARQVIAHGKVNELPVELQSHAGQTLTMLAEGITNKGVDGTFIGIDYSFREAVGIQTTVSGTANAIPIELAHEVVRFYFKRQMEGLYQTMTNMGGNKLGNLLNEVVNTTAQRQQWNVSMTGNKITDDADSLTMDAYEGILYKAAAYVRKVLGETILTKQVEKVNQKTNPTTFDYIASDWHKKL